MLPIFKSSAELAFCRDNPSHEKIPIPGVRNPRDIPKVRNSEKIPNLGDFEEIPEIKIPNPGDKNPNPFPGISEFCTRDFFGIF